MRLVTIVVADDHNVVRQGLCVLLKAEPGFSVIAEATDGPDAIELVERLCPDVLLLDLMMPNLDGLEVTRQISKRAPKTKVVILSMHANDAYVVEALHNGAVGYVLKDSNATDLILAVHEVMNGRRYLSPPLSERAIDIYLQKSRCDSWDTHDQLTAREREVLRLVSEGYTTAEIADRLMLSPRTVEMHRRNMMHKLGLHNQLDVFRYAVQHGIVQIAG
jgi:DNA-binding NarL/FixJ family response regulator